MLDNIKTNWKYYIVALAMLIIALVGSILVITTSNVDVVFDANSLHCYNDEQIYSITPIPLDKGIYNISIKYSSSDGANVNVYTNDVRSHKTIYTENPQLSKTEFSKSFNIWVNDDINDIEIEVRPIEGSLYVNSIAVSTAWNSKLYGVTCYVLAFLFIVLILLANKFRTKYKKYKIQIFVIALITIFSSLDLFVRYLMPGHDLVFHFLRIEGLKDAILMGDIPARVQTNWNFGYGYAVSAMYGDTPLLLPALMRILGFTIQTSYKTFIFVVNLLTAICTYLCFRKMTKKDLSAYIGTFLYVCAPYRLINIYNRAAVGEFVGMLFLPIIVLTFYYAYHEDDSKEGYGKHIVLPVIGLSGLLQTHLLSCLMIAFFIIPFCIINYKKTFSRNRLWYLVKIVGLTALVNLWFIIPFIRFMNEPLAVSSAKQIAVDIQAYGLSIPEIFAQYSSGHFWYNFAFLTSLSNRNTMSLGNGITVLLICFVILKLLKKLGKRTKCITYLSIMTIISLWLSSNLFPYSFLIKYCPFIARILTKVQFPYRYLTLAILFGSLFAMAFYDKLVKKCKKNIVLAITCVTLLIASSQSLNHMYALLYSGSCTSNYDGASLNSAEVIGAEYLYNGTDLDSCNIERSILGNNVDVTMFRRSRNRFDVECASTGTNGTITLPIFAYPGYIAKTEFGDSLKVSRGLNNRLEVAVPDNFLGTIIVRYKEPLLWRGAELISLLSIVLLIYIYECNKRGVEDDKIS